MTGPSPCRSALDARGRRSTASNARNRHKSPRDRTKDKTHSVSSSYAHHRQNGMDLAEMLQIARQDFRAGELRDQQIVKISGFVRRIHHERLAIEIVDGDGVCGGESMPIRRGDQERFGNHARRYEFGAPALLETG